MPPSLCLLDSQLGHDNRLGSVNHWVYLDQRKDESETIIDGLFTDILSAAINIIRYQRSHHNVHSNFIHCQEIVKWNYQNREAKRQFSLKCNNTTPAGITAGSIACFAHKISKWRKRLLWNRHRKSSYSTSRWFWSKCTKIELNGLWSVWRSSSPNVGRDGKPWPEDCAWPSYLPKFHVRVGEWISKVNARWLVNNTFGAQWNPILEGTSL